MAHLSISVFGSLQVTLDGRPVTAFEYNKVRALLIYLVVEAAHPQQRDTLATLFWADLPHSASRLNLRQALATLRRAIGDSHAHPSFFHIARDMVQFNRASSYTLDSEQFCTLYQHCAHHSHPSASYCADCVTWLQQAVRLYRGDFLAQFPLKDSAAFEEWAQIKREEYHRTVLDMLRQLADSYECVGAYDQACHYAWQQLILDPWREEAHRQLMRLLTYRGQRSAALVQYRRCCQALATDLGVPPSGETVALYESIRDAFR